MDDPDNNAFGIWRPFYTQCGQLFISFGRLESLLSSLVRENLSSRMRAIRYPNSADYAAVLLGSQRFKALQDTIKRIVQHEAVLSDEQRAAYQNVFEQCGHIAAVRDKLAHQFVQPNPEEEGAWFIADTFSTRDLTNVRVWQIRSADLSNASHDLRRAIEWLDAGGKGRLLEFIPTEPPTWRYKSSALKRLKTGKLRSPRKRSSPPQSFGG